MIRRIRNSSAPRKLLKDLGCISTLWGIENRFGRKMCNTLRNGRLDHSKCSNAGVLGPLRCDSQLSLQQSFDDFAEAWKEPYRGVLAEGKLPRLLLWTFSSPDRTKN
jgi:hypothetical protein